MFCYYYEIGSYESKTFPTYEAAEAAYDEIAQEVGSIFGYCDPDYLFIDEA